MKRVAKISFTVNANKSKHFLPILRPSREVGLNGEKPKEKNHLKIHLSLSINAEL